MFRKLACVACLLLSALGWAQSDEQTKTPANQAPAEAESAAFRPVILRFPVQEDSAVTLSQFNGRVPSQMKCDADGNVYGAFAAGSANSITRILTDGSQPVAFSLAAVPDLGAQTQNSSPPTLAEFAVGTDGSVYLLVLVKRQDSSNASSASPRRMDPGNFEYHVISFNSDGKYHSQFKLDPGLAPNRIAVFSSGDLMLAGSEPDPEDEDTRIPFAGVFDSSGRFMKDVSMPRDLRSPEGSQSQSAGGNAWNRRGSVGVRGNAQGANDGNVYLLPNAAGAPVYVLSPGGEIVRTIKLESGKNERLGMSVAAGRLISWSQHGDSRRPERVNSSAPSEQAPAAGANDTLFRFFNLQSGELAAEYTASQELGSFACYSAGDFTFVRLDSAHHLQVVAASPH